MTLFTRRFITISFIISFFIIAPITLFYTNGFRYNWQKKKISEVGILALKTFPTNAQVYLNNKLLPIKSPIFLNDIEPNIYTVRAELPGYFAWQKNLEVKNRESTLAYDVVLFKQSKPQLLYGGDINAYAFDRSKQHLVIAKNSDTIEILDQNYQKKITLYKTLEKKLQRVKLSWSANNSYILVENTVNPVESFIIPTDGRRPVRFIASIIGDSFSSPRFDIRNESLYCLSKGKLIKITLNPISNVVVQHNTRAIENTPLGLITLSTIKNGIQVSLFTNRLLLEPTQKLANLPEGNYSILQTSTENLIALVNNTKNKILLINTNNASRPAIEINGTNGIFGGGNKNQIFMAFDGEELTIFDISKNHSTLLGRFSKAPKEAFPLYNIPYYLLYKDNQLQITELDDRDKRNTLTIIENSDLNNITLNLLSTKIFYTASDGLFAVDLQ